MYVHRYLPKQINRGGGLKLKAESVWLCPDGNLYNVPKILYLLKLKDSGVSVKASFHVSSFIFSQPLVFVNERVSVLVAH
jgi:hypothetical protein